MPNIPNGNAMRPCCRSWALCESACAAWNGSKATTLTRNDPFLFSLHARPMPESQKIELDIKQIMERLPHRYPMLLVDRVLEIDRKSTRLNSSHVKISYAVFCLIQNKNLI